MPIAIPARRLVVTLVALAAALAGSTTAPLAQQRVGVNSAVNPAATGTPPGGQARRLVVGQDVVYNERIATTEGGQTQLLFVDESAMTVGPNSDVTIDQFVYDPNTGTGKMAMTASRGVLRYIGGRLSKEADAVTLRTENATIAVRGGAFVAEQTPGGKLDVYFIYGKGVTVTGANGASETLHRAGFAITVPARGASPSLPYLAPPGTLARLSTQLDGRPGATGGATRPPTEATVASSGISTDISANLPASVQQAAQNRAAQAGAQLVALNPGTVQSNAQINTVQNQGSPIIQAADTGSQSSLPPAPAPTPTPAQPTTVTITFAGLGKGKGTSLGFTDQTANNRVPYTNGTLTYPIGQPQNGQFNATLNNGLNVNFPLPPGTNNVQGNSTNGPITATTVLTPDQTFFYANATETQNGQRDFIFGGTPVNPAFFQPTTTNQFYTFNVQPDPTINSVIPFVPGQFGGNTPNAVVSPLLLATSPNTQFGAFNPNTNPNGGPSPRWLQSSIAFNGSGPTQSSAFVVNTGDFFTTSDTGTVAGAGPVRGSFLANGTSPLVRLSSASATVPDGNNNNLFGANAITGFVLDQNNYDTSLALNQQLAAAVPYGQAATNYAFNHPVIAAGTPAIGSRTTQGLSGFFGGVMYPFTPGTGFGSPYALQGAAGVGTDATNNRVFVAFAGSDPFTPAQSGVSSININFGSIGGRSFARDTFIDDTRFAAAESPSSPSSINGNTLPVTPGSNFTPRLGLVTSGVLNNALPNGVTPCACQFLQWGYWTGELDTPNAAQTAATRIDRAHINSWLAGIPTSAADINTLQGQAFTGSYAGHVVGSVVNNGASYVAAGGFNSTYNFGTNVGTVSVNNFDGRTVTGSVSGSGGIIVGNLAAPGVNGSVQGRFFGPLAKETGGNFAIRSTVPGTSYIASGIFAGAR